MDNTTAGQGRKSLEMPSYSRDWSSRSCSIDASFQSSGADMKIRLVRRKKQGKLPAQKLILATKFALKADFMRNTPDLETLKPRRSINPAESATFKLTYTSELWENAEEVDSLQALLPIFANIDRIWQKLSQIPGLRSDFQRVSSYSGLYKLFLPLLRLPACPSNSSPYEVLLSLLGNSLLQGKDVKELYSIGIQHMLVCRKCAWGRISARAITGLEVNAVESCWTDGKTTLFANKDFYSEETSARTDVSDLLQYAETVYEGKDVEKTGETGLEKSLQYALRTSRLELACPKCYTVTPHFKFTRISRFPPCLFLHIPPTKARVPVRIPSAFRLQGQMYTFRGLIVRTPAYTANRYQSLLYRGKVWSCLTQSGLRPYVPRALANPHFLIYLSSP